MQKRTLWQMLVETWRGKKVIVDNPLNADKGSSIMLRELDYEQSAYSVVGVYEYKYESSGLKFIDYDLKSSDGGFFKIRACHKDGNDYDNFILLKKYDEKSYDDGLESYLNGKDGEFQVNENGEISELYYRINEIRGFYSLSRRVYGDGELSEPSHFSLWDFWREIKDEGGTPFNQYLFIEMSNDDGWFCFWQGFEISRDSIMVT